MGGGASGRSRTQPKHGLSKDRYELYCGAATFAEAAGLGMKSGVKSGGAYYDLDHGYLQIFPDSLRVEALAMEDAKGGGRPGTRKGACDCAAKGVCEHAPKDASKEGRFAGPEQLAWHHAARRRL